MTWLGILVLAGLIVSSGWFLRRADAAKPEDWLDSQLTYIPSGKMLKPMVLDMDEAAAGIIWVRAMVYFADAYLEGKSYKWLGHILDVVTTLNPRFRHAYEFAGVVLTRGNSEIPKTLKLLDRGISEFPDDWRLRVYASLARINYDSNYVRASEYLQPLTHHPDVPPHIRTMSATLLEKGKGRRAALAFLINRYLRSENTINRRIFIDKMIRLYPGSGAPAGEEERRGMIEKILREAMIEPQAEMIAVVVADEYLADSLSARSRHLIRMLDNPADVAGPDQPRR